MCVPPLVLYKTETEYRTHYERVYCYSPIITTDGIRVFFGKQRFNHAFYVKAGVESGPKDVFAKERAEKIDWIKATLENPNAELFDGWISKE